MVEVPADGGKITEGIIGLPRYINPVLAVTEADKDISALVYSGLMRQTPKGDIVPDLAESYTLSPDGKVYTFTLKPYLTFHDGSPVTADDVVFTIGKIQTASIKSPKRANWDGVSVEKVDERTVKFILHQAYAPFLENTTVGILSEKAWTNTSDDTFSLSVLNTSPVGTGPYKLKSIAKNSDGIPLSYTLEANKNFAFGAPHVSAIVFTFYSNEKALTDAYAAGEILNLSGVSADTALSLQNGGAKILTALLPRVFGVFFNQSQNAALADKTVRQALDMSVDKDYIIRTVLHGFAAKLSGPMPESFVGSSTQKEPAVASSTEDLLNQANAILDKTGWNLNSDGIREKKTDKGTTTLAFSISTGDTSELKEIADILKTQWRKIGADVSVKVFEGGYLNQSIIRPRKYDALLFGQIVNKDFDLYAFWHSSQRADPGLNIALYSNPKADKSLENIRTLSDKEARKAEYLKFAAQVDSDKPAVFLYAPDFIYIVSPNILNLSVDNLSTPSDRFNSVYDWYINKEHLWKIFAHN